MLLKHLDLLQAALVLSKNRATGRNDCELWTHDCWIASNEFPYHCPAQVSIFNLSILVFKTLPHCQNQLSIWEYSHNSWGAVQGRKVDALVRRYSEFAYLNPEFLDCCGVDEGGVGFLSAYLFRINGGLMHLNIGNTEWSMIIHDHQS